MKNNIWIKSEQKIKKLDLENKFIKNDKETNKIFLNHPFSAGLVGFYSKKTLSNYLASEKKEINYKIP